MAKQPLMVYKGFDIGEDKATDGWTKFPIYFQWHGRTIDHCETVDVAMRAIDAMPKWLADKMREIDMWNETQARIIAEAKKQK